MKILIAGGAGFIGSHLTKYFLKNNHSVTVIDNFITGKKDNLKEVLNNNSLQLIEADLIDFNFANLSSFDILYNLASPASPKQFFKIPLKILKTNSLGTLNLIEFFIKSRSKTFVFASTSEVYGDPAVSPQPETYFGYVNPVGVRSCYDESKRFAESLITAYFRKYHCDLRIARIFNTYGPKMDKNDGRVVSNFINQAIKNKSITVYGNGKQTRSLCFVDDMVKGLYLLSTKKNLNGEIINLGNPNEKTVLELAYLIKKLTNSQSKIVFLSAIEDDPKKRCPDISKAKKLLGWQPEINLEKGLKLTINYFKNL